ncbi:putative retrotransposon hot spot (RHS) protein, partial [Trypanosoma conorhini]
MTERGGEETHAAAESPATNAQRRWRSGSDGGGSNQPPAQRRRVVEAPAGPQWALYSTVEEVLRLEGVDAPEQMTLNDFIIKYLGPKFVVDEGHGIKMGVVIQGPEEFITDPELRGTFLRLPAYQRLVDARNLHADARNLIRQGVYSLG